MFKRLGTFVVLAVCLFAIAIVMGGCGNGDDEEVPAYFISASPESGSTLESDATIVLSFGGTPKDVSVNVGQATVTVHTVAISGPFRPGNLDLVVKWDGGEESFTYTVNDDDDGVGISKGDFVDLSGLYSYETPELGGVLSLFPAAADFEANLWFLTDDLEISDNSGTWTADRSNIDLLDRVYRYTWNGTHLTIRNLRTPDGRKDIRWLREEDWSD